mmetsp:Transcript_108496/g.171500  ORF Transcript_108496/g.171500 Transcript_108496/m.171500 type:complete len:99 (+) Transcript_108496:354-650(+)
MRLSTSGFEWRYVLDMLQDIASLEEIAHSSMKALVDRQMQQLQRSQKRCVRSFLLAIVGIRKLALSATVSPRRKGRGGHETLLASKRECAGRRESQQH